MRPPKHATRNTRERVSTSAKIFFADESEALGDRIAFAVLLGQRREAMRREEEARKRRDEEKRNALKISRSYSEHHYESAMAKITKAAARSEVTWKLGWRKRDTLSTWGAKLNT